MSNYIGQEIKKLGFGYMRLPMNGDKYDLEHTIKMADEYMAKGFTYFDTAYVYINGTSEVALRESVVDRYPRESFQIASKLPPWEVKKEEDMETLFQTSLNRLGTDYIDFYLLHCLTKENIAIFDKFDGWSYIQKLKAEGRVKYAGFSFHDTADVLDDLLVKHPEVDFVQLQINYIDWENEIVQARLCHEVALKHNKPVIIMEPVRGGVLANLTPKADEAFKAYAPESSAASWAIRYCASLDNIITVLSGMSNMEQLQDNVSYMENFKPLNEEEQKVVANVVDIINSTPVIPCTDCKYCVEGCPMNINIPRLFGTVNHHRKFAADLTKPINMGQFNDAIKENGKPSDCISCGACQGHCPQHIEIIEELGKIADLYEK